MSERLTLLPCPFCGGEPASYWIEGPHHNSRNNPDHFRIACCVTLEARTAVEAADKWNGRAAALRTREAQPAEQPNAAQEKLEQSTGAAPRTVFSAESPVAATPQPAEQQAKRYPAGYECDDGRKCLKEDKRECANGCARFPTNGNG